MMYKYLSILIIFYTLQSCQDEDVILEMQSMNCIDPIEDYAVPISEVADSSIIACNNCVSCQELISDTIPFDYKFPCFHPNNDDLFAYYRFDNSQLNSNSEIWIINFCTAEKRMIVDNALAGLDWNRKDWLIYTGVDQNIYKVKSDGDSLTQLTYEGEYNLYPRWSQSGEKIAFETERLGQNYIFISNKDGESIDTINELSNITAWSWVNENELFFVREEFNVRSLNTFNLETKEATFLHTLGLIQSSDSLIINSTLIFGNRIILWCAAGLIGKTYLDFDEYQIIEETLIHEKFNYVALVPGNQEFIVNKSTRHYEGNCQYSNKEEFFLYDFTGNNQRKIILE